jgi:hypothetical protein
VRRLSRRGSQLDFRSVGVPRSDLDPSPAADGVKPDVGGAVLSEDALLARERIETRFPSRISVRSAIQINPAEETDPQKRGTIPIRGEGPQVAVC